MAGVRRLNATSESWQRIRQLEGETLETLAQCKRFRIVSVHDDSVRVCPEDGAGVERTVLRERIEYIASLGLAREELRERTGQEYPDSQNTSYIAALAFAVSSTAKK